MQRSELEIAGEHPFARGRSRRVREARVAAELRNERGRGFTLIELLIVVAIIGIIAAIAVPALLRARVSANEAAAIADIRTVMSAEAAYQSSNGGFYDTLPCLSAPNSCIPGYPPTSPTFLDPLITSRTDKNGYSRFFTPGTTPLLPSSVSPSSIPNYVYGATPTTPNQTGVRGFAGDASGRICQDASGGDPAAGAAQLPASCNPI